MAGAPSDAGAKAPGAKALRLLITGRVQGVWYRAWTIEQATARGLRGWVRNRQDGSVEALISGPADKVDDMVQACRSGPKLARVDGIEIFAAEGNIPDGFHERPTA
jgi:acylphosphatase